MLNFVLLIAEWYRQTARNLPWRNTKNPYKIWLSEVILQQTRVEQGLPYYLKFTENFPTVIDLANAEEETVLKNWQGLGYYSRARNLHAAAKMIRDLHLGNFPHSYSDILKLKGVGEYTAAAVASFAFNLPHAVVDGNVYRVLSRFYDIDTPIDSTEGKKLFYNLANELLLKEDPALFNQAMMEFGAMQCVPVNPDCGSCPVRPECLGYKNGTVSLRPVKAKKTKVTDRYFYYMVFHNDHQLVLKKRGPKDVWQGLYDFPLIESPSKLDEENYAGVLGISLSQIKKQHHTKHILSHQRIFAAFLYLDFLPEKTLWKEDWELAEWSRLEKYPLPRIIERYLKEDLKALD